MERSFLGERVLKVHLNCVGKLRRSAPRILSTYHFHILRLSGRVFTSLRGCRHGLFGDFFKLVKACMQGVSMQAFEASVAGIASLQSFALRRSLLPGFSNMESDGVSGTKELYSARRLLISLHVVKVRSVE